MRLRCVGSERGALVELTLGRFSPGVICRHARVTTFDTPVGEGAQLFMHAIRCEAGTAASGTPPLVLVPGYGAGSAFFWRNLGPLATESARTVFAVDWLGAGLSGRPAFTPTGHDAAVSWFISSLEAWRQHNAIPRFALVGHSLGGYLACRYALAYPEQVTHLVLVSPAGMAARNGPPPDGLLYKAIAGAWNAGVTPHGVFRFLGPFAEGRAQTYASRRFHEGDGLNAAEESAFARYLHHTLSGRGSAEYALPHVLAPGAWAKQPLLDAMRSLSVPHITFVYGARDWMDWRSGAEAVDLLHSSGKGIAAELVRIPNAGHYPYIANPAAFHAAIGAVLQRGSVEGGAQRAVGGSPDELQRGGDAHVESLLGA